MDPISICIKTCNPHKRIYTCLASNCENHGNCPHIIILQKKRAGH